MREALDYTTVGRHIRIYQPSMDKRHYTYIHLANTVWSLLLLQTVHHYLHEALLLMFTAGSMKSSYHVRTYV